jgi:hypothetical protein
MNDGSGSDEKKTPVWVWIGLGCLIPVVLIAVLIGGVAFVGYKTVKHVTADTPEEREASAKKILGTTTIPEGYYPQFTLSIPFIADFTLLGDHPFDPKADRRGALGERGFFYVNSIKGNDQGRQARDIVEGKADAKDVSNITGQGGLRVGALELIRRGSFPAGKGTVLYAANRGDVTSSNKPVKGLVTLFFVDCPSDKRTRFGTWFGPDPKADEPIAAADFSGTPADEGAIRAFLGNFSFCP